MEQFVVRIAHAQRETCDVAIVAVRTGALLTSCGDVEVFVLSSGPSRLLRAVRAILVAGRMRPHIVHAHNFTSLHYASLIRSVSRAKLVLTDHSQGAKPARVPRPSEWRSTSAVVAVSHVTAASSHWYPSSLPRHVIHNGIESVAPTRSRAVILGNLGIPTDRIVATMVGRMDGMKGHDVLVEALALCRDSGMAPFVTLIAGDGRSRAATEQLARQERLGPEWIRFLGFRSDIADVLGASDLFVLPSLSEGLPLSVLEAMAAGLPVIASRVGGVPELIENGKHGILIEAGNPSSLSSALIRIVENPQLRRSLGNAAAARVESDFRFDRMIREYRALYDSLIGARRDPANG